MRRERLCFSQASILAVAGLLQLAGGLSHACQICIPFPQKSPADQLIESEGVVLAREDPERPFCFVTVEVLKGSPGPEKIDLFLDTTTRRHLSLHPGHSVLLVKGSGAGDSGWRRIGLMDETFGPVVRETLQRAHAWKDRPSDRTAFFAKRLGDVDPQVRTLAHLELARAPYAEIRKYGGVLSRETIHAFLAERRYVEWHPLYLLLLAQSGHPEDAARIRRSMESAARFAISLNLSAWSTALVEVDQEKGVQFLEENYLCQPSRSDGELRAIIAALSVQGSSGNDALLDRIVSAYGLTLKIHPELAPDLVKDLLAWRRYDLSERVADLASARPPAFDLTTLLKLRTYAKHSDTSPSAQR
ncbi:MAG: hypothetical protein R3F31_03065 [Verrucomicrobiales bacterium]